MAHERPLVGPGAPPCSAIMEQATRSLDLPTILTLTPLMMSITDQADKMTDEEMNTAGIAARRFLAVGWEQAS